MIRMSVIILSKYSMTRPLNFQNCVQRMRHVLKSMLWNDRILASLLVGNAEVKTCLDHDQALHITVRDNYKLFEHALVDRGCVDTVDDFRGLVAN